MVEVEAVLGSTYSDLLTGDDMSTRLEGRGGRDVGRGQAGDDTLWGGDDRVLIA